MKYLHVIVILAVVLLAVPVWAEDKALPEPLRLIAPIKVGEKLELRVWGFGLVNYLADSQTDELKWTNLRLNANLDGPKLGIGLVLSLSDFQESTNGNWLRECYMQYKLTDKLKLRGGLLLLACGRGNAIPGPFKLETVDFPIGWPYSDYATGLQAIYDDQDWQAIWDITGKSGEPFNSARRFDRLESSALLKCKFDSCAIGGVAQVSRDFLKAGALFEWKNDRWFFRTEFDYSDYRNGKTSNEFGGYGLLGVRIFPWWQASAEAMFNQKLPKFWTETITSVDNKTGKISIKEVDKQSSAEVKSGLLFTNQWFFDRRGLIWLKLGYLWQFEGNGQIQAQAGFRF